VLHLKGFHSASQPASVPSAVKTNVAVSKTTGKGNPWLAATLGEIVISASRTNTFFGERYRRLARRRGKQRAIVAVANSVLTAVWHLLSQPETRYQDLGAEFYQSHLNRQRHERNLVRQLEHLTGKKVTLTPPPEQAAA
jgi:transposase